MGVGELEDVDVDVDVIPQIVVGSYSPRGDVVKSQTVTYSSIAELQVRVHHLVVQESGVLVDDGGAVIRTTELEELRVGVVELHGPRTSVL